MSKTKNRFILVCLPLGRQMMASQHWWPPLCGHGQRNVRLGLGTVDCGARLPELGSGHGWTGPSLSPRQSWGAYWGHGPSQGGASSKRGLPPELPPPRAQLPPSSQQAKAVVQTHLQGLEEPPVGRASRQEGVREQGREKGIGATVCQEPVGWLPPLLSC